MLEKTRGIVIGSIKFRESSIIVKIYTERFGIQSFIVNGVRSKKPKHPSALFQSLTLLDLVIYFKENQSLKRLHEVKCIPPFKNIPFDFYKSSLALFISEILQKTIKEESPDEDLFKFVYQAILILDIEERNPDFHLLFLIKFSFFLGFAPAHPEDISADPTDRYWLSELLKETDYNQVITSNQVRRRILDVLIRFYRGQIEGFHEINSIKVLTEILK